MRSRLASLTLVASVCIALTACGGGDGKITIGKASDAPPTTAAGATDETTLDTVPEDTGPPIDMGTVPDLGSIPDLPENMAACTELAAAMSSMAMSAVGSPIPDETKAQIEEIRQGLPEAVAKDLDTLIDAYTKLSQANGDLGAAAAAVSAPEFTAASDRLSAFFQETCSG